MLVIVTKGRMASYKAVILDILSDNRLLITGYINKKRRTADGNGAKMFLKRMNPLHVLATSHTLSFSMKVEESIFQDQKLKREIIGKIETEMNKQTVSEANWMRTKLKVQ